VIYQSEQGNLSVALGGDVMLTRRLSVFAEQNFLALADIFRSADVGFGNLEGPVRHWEEGTPGITHGTYMTTPPEYLADLKWFGINLLSCANNHAFDYGEGGLLATIRHLDAAGIAHAGSGRSLAEARSPAYLDTPNGRVALVAATSRFRPWNAAGEQRPDATGRPGINPVGSKVVYRIPQEKFEALREIGTGLGFDIDRQRSREHFFSAKEVPAEGIRETSFLGSQFVSAVDYGISSHADANDVEDNLRSIRDARRQADWVIFSMHYHEFGGEALFKANRTDMETPADFIVDLLHAAIDAGADVVAGHGSHTPLGVEIYKGKPIFYSVGNLVFQNETVRYFPSGAYERFDLDHKARPADFLDARTDGDKKGHPAKRGYWENMVARCRFEKRMLTRITLHPIDHGFGRPRAQRGRPVLASGETAERMLSRIQDLCARYGTSVETLDGTAVIRF
jgi:poly-gamma-glutamate synthesis protein (capsule biosynthesis protein)